MRLLSEIKLGVEIRQSRNTQKKRRKNITGKKKGKTKKIKND